MNPRLTSKEFALVLGNETLTPTFLDAVATGIGKVQENFNRRFDWGVIKIRYVKTLKGDDTALKIETDSFVFGDELADAFHEVLPNYGLAVMNWVDYLQSGSFL